MIEPDWPAPATVRSVLTTVTEGNLALHVGDPVVALARRKRLVQAARLPREPYWLNQVHGNEVLIVGSDEGEIRTDHTRPDGDAAFTRTPGQPLVVMVADCLPILLADSKGTEIAVVHAGWRGLAAGVIGAAVSKFREPRSVMAWLGPAIGPCHYEVDVMVRSGFAEHAAFLSGRDSDHWMLDLFREARRQLEVVGIERTYGGDQCTFCDPEFYSHRRGSPVGRFAAIIWLAPVAG